MARRKKRRVKRDKRVPLISTAGLLAGLMTINRNNAVEKIKKGDVQAGLMSAVTELVVGATGYDIINKSWNFKRIGEFYIPIIVGVAGSAIATKLGINRRMKALPIIGRYIKL